MTNIPFTYEQLDNHIAALVVYLKRIERTPAFCDDKINELMQAGDKESIAEAQKLYNTKEQCLKKIDVIKKEIVRMRKIFKGMQDGQAEK